DARKVSLLVVVPAAASLFGAQRVSAPTDEPAKTPRSVLKPLPARVIVVAPVPVAVQLNQTDLPPALPLILGSPVSRVALTLVAVTVTDRPVSHLALENLSFAGRVMAGAAISETATVTLPVKGPLVVAKPSTARS